MALNLPVDVISHHVRADLLQAAELAGGLPPTIAEATVMRELGRSTDAVILTCSTLGPAVDGLAGTMSVPAFRVDAALARQAIDFGGNVIVLCAVETTLEPTARLFAETAKASSTIYEIRLVAGAWALFKSGDLDGYHSKIADAVEDAYRDGASIVALAQASMAGAADLVKTGHKPLSSPIAGLSAAIHAIR